MGKTLVIVESQGKISKIKAILGSEYEVMASFGHVMDLDGKVMSVDIKHNFEPNYVIMKGKDETVTKIKKAAKNASTILLATDEDREGEMIAWSLAHVLKIKDAKRITFTSITKTEILKAVKNPRKIDMPMVNAQKARRILDRLVGYELSPILWKSIKASLSAGRVQSVVARLIIDKEREIQEFFKKETSSYFKYAGTYEDKKKKKVIAQLY
jgi:DNA topoisomerase-1